MVHIPTSPTVVTYFCQHSKCRYEFILTWPMVSLNFIFYSVLCKDGKNTSLTIEMSVGKILSLPNISAHMECVRSHLDGRLLRKIFSFSKEEGEDRFV
jgi:hypothetical protein